MSFRTAYQNTHSENGWRMVDRNECVTVAGTYMNTAPLRQGPPAIVLGDFARRYHVECAPIVSPVWGWSATNTVANSNHLSGTALDINAPQWPWGTRKMGATLVGKIERLLADYGGAVFWGRGWNKADEMHFQCGWPEGDSRWPGAVAKIEGTTTPVDDGVLRLGSEGDAVRELQTGLNRVFPTYSQLDADGIYGPLTVDVVTEFQTRTWVNGIVADATRAALARYGIVPAVWPQSATDRELLEYVAEQVGPGHPAWPSAGMTLRDKIFTL